MQEQPFQFTDEAINQIFGSEDAESESISRLKQYYLKNSTYKRVLADLPLRILVGHKGTGKSALFKVAFSEEKERNNFPVLLKPDQIAELGKSDENFLLKIRQWRTGLHRIIVRTILSELNIDLDKYQKEINQFNSKVYPLLSKIISNHPNSSQQGDEFLNVKKIVIYIDDLDRGWEGKKDDIQRISSLLNCLRDFSNDDSKLQFKISLRSDVYYLVRTSDESTDKIEGSVVWHKWDFHEIYVMLIKRVNTYFDQEADYDKMLLSNQSSIFRYLECIFSPKFEGQGKWNNVPMQKVLLSLIRKRPRDLVKLLTLAAREAADIKDSKIRTIHITRILDEYSQGRIQDTVNEYRSELPGIEKLLWGFKPVNSRKRNEGFIYDTPALHQKIRNIMTSNRLRFANGKPTTEKSLSHFLYKINFITARKEDDEGRIERVYFQENRYLKSNFVDFGYSWEIPLVYRWCLKPADHNYIYYNYLPNY